MWRKKYRISVYQSIKGENIIEDTPSYICTETGFTSEEAIEKVCNTVERTKRNGQEPIIYPLFFNHEEIQ